MIKYVAVGGALWYLLRRRKSGGLAGHRFGPAHEAKLRAWDALTRADINRMSRATLIAWLEWNDPNGDYQPEEFSPRVKDQLVWDWARNRLDAEEVELPCYRMSCLTAAQRADFEKWLEDTRAPDQQPLTVEELRDMLLEQRFSE